MSIEPTHKALPGPALTAGPWVVHDVPATLAGTILPNPEHPGVLAVPLDDSRQGFAVRALEYGKLALYRMGLDPDVQQWAIASGINPMWTDAAIDYLATKHMLATGTGAIAERPAPPPLKTKASEAQLTASALKYNTTDQPPAGAHKGAAQYAASALNDLHDSMFPSGIKTATKDLLQVCRVLQEYFNELAERRRSRSGPHTPEDGGEASDALDSLAEDGTLTRGGLDGLLGAVKSGRGCWGSCTLRNPPRTKRYNQALSAMRPKPGFFGGLRYPHRVLLPAGDGQGFAAKRRVRGGTMLVDCSGSMNMQPGHIDHLLSMAPAMTVALYGGIGYKGLEGEVVVIVRKGRGVQSIADIWGFDGKNVVDGPALEWLCGEDGPRIWISDGGVTGVHDATSPSLRLEAERILRKGRIKRFGDIDTFLSAYEHKVLKVR